MEDFVTINGKKYRFEANFNALGKALKALDMDNLEGLVDISQLKPSTFPTLFACCLNEGARLQGVEWRITPEDTGCLPMTAITEMMKVYIRQSQPDITVGEDGKKETEAGK